MNRGQFFGLATTGFTQGLGVSMVATFIGIYADLFKLSGTEVGIVTTALYLSEAAILYPLGRKADAGSRKRLLLFGLLLGIPTYTAFWRAQNIQMLVIARLLQGFSVTMALITALSFVGLRSPEQKKGHYIGWFTNLQAAGNTIGALTAGYLVANFGFGLPYGVLIILSIFCGLLVYQLIPREVQDAENDRDIRNLLAKTKFHAQILFETGFAFAKAIMIAFIPVYAYVEVGLSETQLGIVMAALFTPMAIGQGFTGNWSDRIGRRPLIIGGGLLYLFGACLLPWQLTFWRLVGISALLGLADTIRIPASWAVFADEGVESGPATAFSFRMLAWMPGSLIGPLLGGVIKDTLGIATTFYTVALTITIAVSLYVSFQARAGDD